MIRNTTLEFDNISLDVEYNYVEEIGIPEDQHPDSPNTIPSVIGHYVSLTEVVIILNDTKMDITQSVTNNRNFANKIKDEILKTMA